MLPSLSPGSRIERLCLDNALAGAGDRVLELGIGTGSLFEALVRANPHGYTEGIDESAIAVARARRRIAELPGHHQLRVWDAGRLRCGTSAFDAVVGLHFFDALPETGFARVLGDVRRALVAGGRLVLVHLSATEGWLDAIHGTVAPLLPEIVRPRRRVDLGPYVEAMGFDEVRVAVVRRLGFRWEIVTARAPAARRDGGN